MNRRSGPSHALSARVLLLLLACLPGVCGPVGRRPATLFPRARPTRWRPSSCTAPLRGSWLAVKRVAGAVPSAAGASTRFRAEA